MHCGSFLLMAPKIVRSPNDANVSAQAKKVSRNLADVEKDQEKVHFKRQLAELATMIAANPEVLTKQQALMEAQLVHPDHDHDVFFDAQDLRVPFKESTACTASTTFCNF